MDGIGDFVTGEFLKEVEKAVRKNTINLIKSQFKSEWKDASDWYHSRGRYHKHLTEAQIHKIAGKWMDEGLITKNGGGPSLRREARTSTRRVGNGKRYMARGRRRVYGRYRRIYYGRSRRYKRRTYGRPWRRRRYRRRRY